MTTSTTKGQFKTHFDLGIEKLKEMADAQPAAQRDMFLRLMPEMSALADHYDTIAENSNYESHGHAFIANRGLAENDKRVVVAFTSQAIKFGRESI